MKKWIMIWGMLLFIGLGNVNAQSFEVQQLLLDVDKLSQLKKILSNMYQGYEYLTKGYNTIRDISKGNFSIHQLFLNGLLQVSPAVKKYKRVADIITYQAQLVKEYKSGFKKIVSSGQFSEKEISYVQGVYSNLLSKSAGHLDELVMVITAGKLRMSDEERISSIDRIYVDMEDQMNFLHDFTKENNLLALQRGRDRIDTKIGQKLNGL